MSTGRDALVSDSPKAQGWECVKESPGPPSGSSGRVALGMKVTPINTNGQERESQNQNVSEDIYSSR